ncbi:hypothetical protein ABZ759_30430 [Streptomyces sp. NPDC047860]|uniref:hypothetical protein n=1 Tax=Streptomyces sp. NPDC047860 TaxID=3155743 RepID=UPI0034014E64
MPKESADALAAALEELHWSTRQPEHVIMAALVAVALEQLPAVEQQIKGNYLSFSAWCRVAVGGRPGVCGTHKVVD